MMQPPQLIVMLTYNDHTVLDAAEIFARCKDSKAEFWGFKEAPLPLEQMKTLYRSMKDAGKTTFLEVVEYTENASLVRRWQRNVAAMCSWARCFLTR